MNTRMKVSLMGLAVVFIACVVVFGFFNKNAQAPMVEQKTVISDTHPHIELSPGQKIIWTDATHFQIYNENNLKPNERIVTITSIKKTDRGYLLTVQDYVNMTYGGVMDDGSVEETNGGYGAVSLRGSGEITLPESVSGTYIGASGDAPLKDVALTAQQFAEHFQARKCYTGQYGCIDFQNLYWGMEVIGDQITSFKQAYQE